ncbi:MAG TPA: hypothetical protein VK674_03620 [Candidatus Limnocylindria bacterium]|nr:hypothetical protein [Candidatus Limnocylindria bacterium]
MEQTVLHGLILEEHSFGANPGTKDLARHLFTRMYCGKVVIIANNPLGTLAALRKQWLKLARKAQKETASTLNATRTYELNQLIIKMHTLQFTAKWPQIDYPADVYVISVQQALQWPPEPSCRTLYVTCDTERLYLTTSWLDTGGLVVICKLAT